ncbi:hypothetical protein OS493_012549 [Desmophyllum pertusum]|uniref:Uncharacterized protein n=1 Tax=Desmophyllum pertusum TaxID=174260 RepID=A0A9W9ZDR7_9CNID|nr:hypothetical protein OS493_012549 [Desmophyllum pertusum]
MADKEGDRTFLCYSFRLLLLRRQVIVRALLGRYEVMCGDTWFQVALPVDFTPHTRVVQDS